MKKAKTKILKRC